MLKRESFALINFCMWYLELFFTVTTQHNVFLSFSQVQHLSWVNQYKAVRSSIGIQWPGYMIHESGVWSPAKQLWHFLPRRCSHEPYNETKDEVMGCNYLITADANFKHIHAFEVCNLFSSVVERILTKGSGENKPLF